MTYKAKEYWQTRSNPNRKEPFEFSAPERLLSDHVTGSVLDFGCGVGRTFELYEKATDVIGVDFVETYRSRAIFNAANMPWDFHHLIHDIYERDFPYPDNSFETGVLCMVLLHAEHQDAVRILKSMGRVCKKLCILNYYHNGQELAEHVFAHDHQALLNEAGLEIDYFAYDENVNHIFLLTK